jgi:desulfoferrodoxin (superoxide reductase-like protein)
MHSTIEGYDPTMRGKTDVHEHTHVGVIERKAAEAHTISAGIGSAKHRRH